MDHFALVGSPSDPGYDDHLLALCERYEVDVVLPQTTREVEHLSYEEIVAITGLPEGTVKSRLHRARLALKEAVDALTDGKKRGT